MNNLPHPIQYQGSKRNLASSILVYVPEDVDCLIEPFAGSAAISIAVAARKIARTYIINDINKPLTELLRLIIESPVETATFYENIWSEQHGNSINSIEHYYKIREIFNNTQDPRLFLYLLARCVKGSVRYNSNGEFNQSPDKRRNGTKPKTMLRNILGVSSLLKGRTEVCSLDYRNVLMNAKDNDLVYMDPPYQGVCGDHNPRYFSGIHHYDFIDTLADLNVRGISYIVSYDGRRAEKRFGEQLPQSLDLTHIELEAGRSSQSTLLGREEVTYESLYLSRALTDRIGSKLLTYCRTRTKQRPSLELFT